MKTIRLQGYRDELWSVEMGFEVQAESVEEARIKVFDDPRSYLVAMGEPHPVELIREFPAEAGDYSEITD